MRSRRRSRDWPDDQNARTVAAPLQPGANISVVARSEGLDPSQLYGWCRKALASGVVSPVTASRARFTRVEMAGAGLIDVVVSDMVVRVGTAFDPDHLVKVLRPVRKASSPAQWWFLLAGPVGSEDTSGPFPAYGLVGRNGLEKIRPNRTRRPLLTVIWLVHETQSSPGGIEVTSTQ